MAQWPLSHRKIERSVECQSGSKDTSFALTSGQQAGEDKTLSILDTVPAGLHVFVEDGRRRRPGEGVDAVGEGLLPSADH